MIPPACTVTVPPVPPNVAVRAGSQVPTVTPESGDQLAPRLDQVPEPPTAVPSPYQSSDVPLTNGVNSTFRSVPEAATEKEPPASELANPAVPLTAAVLTVNLSAAKPEIVVPRANVQEAPAWLSKFAAGPLVSGFVADRLQRLSLKGSAAVAATVSAPVTSSRSQPKPAEPAASAIWKL